MAERYGINLNKESVTLNLVSVYYTQSLSVQHYTPSRKKRIEQGFYGMFRVTDGKGVLTTTKGAFDLKKNDFIFVHYSELVSHVSKDKNYKFYSVYFSAENLILELDKVCHLEIAQEETDNYEKMIASFNAGNQSALLKANSLFGLNLCELLKKMEIRTSPSPYYQQIKNCVEYIHENLSESITTRDLASMCCLCEKHFTSLFTTQMGLSPKQFIIKARLDRAAYLLIYSDKSVEQIAYALNFFSPAYFISTFRKHQGKTPAQYRKDFLAENPAPEPPEFPFAEFKI